jgi:hypothetical protein
MFTEKTCFFLQLQDSDECAVWTDRGVVSVEYISEKVAMRCLIFGGTPCVSYRPLRKYKGPYQQAFVVRHIYVVSNLFASKWICFHTAR